MDCIGGDDGGDGDATIKFRDINMSPTKSMLHTPEMHTHRRMGEQTIGQKRPHSEIVETAIQIPSKRLSVRASKSTIRINGDVSVETDPSTHFSPNRDQQKTETFCDVEQTSFIRSGQQENNGRESDGATSAYTIGLPLAMSLGSTSNGSSNIPVSSKEPRTIGDEFKQGQFEKSKPNLESQKMKCSNPEVQSIGQDSAGTQRRENTEKASKFPANSSYFNSSEMKTALNSNLNDDMFITDVNQRYRNVAIYSVIVWLVLTIFSFIVAYRTNRLVSLTGMEQKAPFVASMLLGMSAFSASLPFLVKGETKNVSGIILCAIVVHSVAFVTDLLISSFPTPVFLDPMSGTKVYLLRWCEWTPLAFVMTFLTEACRKEGHPKVILGAGSCEKTRWGRLTSILMAVKPIPKENIHVMKGAHDNSLQQRADRGRGQEQEQDVEHNDEESKKEFQEDTRRRLGPAYVLAWCQGLSTLCGFLFPFCPGIISWSIVMSISVMLYLLMFYRLKERIIEFRGLSEGTTISERETYQWARLSLNLLKSCAFMWTVLVVAYFVYTFGPLIFPKNKVLNISGFGMICESIIDVLFKSIYMLIIMDVHDTIFDQSARAERRLEEMKQMMGVVWENSSDVICISVRGASGVVTTMLSPTYLKIYAQNENGGKKSPQAIAFELDQKFFQKQTPGGMNHQDPGLIPQDFAPEIVYNVEFGNITKNDDICTPLCKEEIGSIAQLVVRAWNANHGQTLLMHELVRKMQNSHQFSIQCEANITRLEQHAMLIVVRDISERFRRFEAEKKVISETTARLKDAAANRFTRHEVKNGLLAAIGLCDSLRETVPADKDNSLHTLLDSRLEGLKKQGYLSHEYKNASNMTRYLFDLDKTLHEILDTILAEAMARDVIHEVYEPKLERVDLPKLLYSTMNLTGTNKSMKRFPISTTPCPLPEYPLDPQLLKYIHRNAISNACKYGKCGGTVKTEVLWDQKNGLLRMEVINLPGPHHEEILRLGPLAEEIVFSPRKRLTMHSLSMLKIDESHTASHSSGDGAWIMHKCAKTLGGRCNIKFEATKTTFTFECPVSPYREMLETANISHEGFEMPKNVWGIALDDSKIQRKLMVRFFMHAGVAEDRVHIFGSTVHEIRTFDDWAVSFIENHPNDYFLMIIDENLDVQEELDAARQVTISGSLAIADMRKRLLPDQERRCLALIRSANDSASDVAIYNSRAHGFLPKAPIKKDSVREALVPMWLTRFPKLDRIHPRKGSDHQISSFDDALGEVVISMADIRPCMEDINRFISLNGTQLSEKWPILWEKIHALKGDLLTMPMDSMLAEAVGIISSLRGPMPPSDFLDKWQSIKTTMLALEG